MEESVNQSYDKTRMKSKSKGDKPNKTSISYKKSESVSKKVGIKDQRKILQDSRSNSNYHQEIDYEGLYSELGELRELKKYIIGEQDRLNRIFDLCDRRERR